MSSKTQAALNVIAAALAVVAEDDEERFPRTKAVFDWRGKRPRVTRASLRRAQDLAEQEHDAAAEIAQRFIGD